MISQTPVVAARISVLLVGWAVGTLGLTSRCFADADALVVQDMGGQLVTGRISNDLNFTDIPTRVFSVAISQHECLE